MEKDLFEEYGLQVVSDEVEIGKVYPIYGMITNFISDDVDNVIVEINYNIEAVMAINEESKISLLKERSFEPGIFVSEILSKGEKIKVTCQTVIFGKKNTKYHC